MQSLPLRPLLVSGFMATGKTTVARYLAEKWGVVWIDLDHEMERRAGQTIAQMFSSQGERAFRALESQTLLEQLQKCEQKPCVMSLGGGALVDRELRVRVLSQAVVVTLEASVESIVQRARAQDGESGARPLLATGDPEQAVIRLLKERRTTYLEAHGLVATDGRDVADIASEVERIYRADAVVVAAGEQSYGVRIGSDLIESHLAALVGSPSGTLLVSDTQVSQLHGDKARRPLLDLGVKTAQVLLTPGEEHKNLEGLSQIYHAAFESGLDRKGALVGLGGGVVTDMTGFAAATWVRGVRWVGVPTTLLSMVDASVGGKTAVDFQTAKNSVGAFWQPSGVICDVQTLLTESDRAYIGALSEVVKTAIIGDPVLFALLEDQADRVLSRDLELLRVIVDRCVRVKARIVALDERESGIRAHLNLGHTIGHALESSGGYTALTHGEAVSLGLVAALRFGERKGHTPSVLTQRVLDLLVRLRLPHQLSREQLAQSTQLLAHDKKRAGSKVRFIYARAVGDVFDQATELSEIERGAVELAD